MLDVAQPWLPLFDKALPPDPPARKTRRRTALEPTAASDDRAHRAARLAFLGVVSSWALTGPDVLQLLGEPSSSEGERLQRIDAVLGAHRSLLFIAPGPGCAAALLRRSEPALGGAAPLEVMLRDGLPGLARVRAHLLAQVLR